MTHMNPQRQPSDGFTSCLEPEPTTQAGTVAHAPEANLPARFQMNPISVMIVDRDPRILRRETLFFQEHGRPQTVVVGTALGAREALAQAQVLRPEVILFDMALCGSGGTAMIAQFKSVLPETAILARTLPERVTDREALLAAGLDDFVSKFASPSALLRVIQRVCRKRINRRAGNPTAAFESLKDRALDEPNMKKRGKPITILMADDEAADCLVVKTAVEKAHLHNDLRFVENGSELMDYLHRRGKYSKAAEAPRPGLILLDLNMPRKDGREALAEIKADPQLRDIPVVVMTASKADEDFWRARNLGADMYLVKPVTFETLVNVARSLGRYWIEIVEIPQATDTTVSPTRAPDAAGRLA